jgi:hypothetical protein
MRWPALSVANRDTVSITSVCPSQWPIAACANGHGGQATSPGLSNAMSVFDRILT